MPDDPELAELAERITQLHADNQRIAVEQNRLNAELVEILERLTKLRQHPVVTADPFHLPPR